MSTEKNLPTVANPVEGSTADEYDGAQQMSEQQYDKDGRLTRDNFRSYSWDQNSRLVGYDGADGSTAFTYDALGSRISRTAQGVTTEYVLNYGHENPTVATERSGGADQRHYVTTPNGMLLYSIDAATSERRFYHFDETGSTTFLTGEDGAVTDSYGITPYGETVEAVGATANPFTFQGAYGVMSESGTGLFYMRERYYDSVRARFLSRDPHESVEPLQVNPYQYATGDPMTFTDPSRFKPIRCIFDQHRDPATIASHTIPLTGASILYGIAGVQDYLTKARNLAKAAKIGQELSVIIARAAWAVGAHE